MIVWPLSLFRFRSSVRAGSSLNAAASLPKTQNRQGTSSLPVKKSISKSQNSSAGNANGSSDVRAVSSGSTT